MNVIEIEIDRELSNYIESLSYETNARKNLIAFCFSKEIDLDNKIFKKYHDEYIHFNTSFELAKLQLEDTYVKPNYPNAKWHLNFNTNILTITPVNINEVNNA